MDRERQTEQNHLDACLDIIRENLRLYEEKERAYKAEITDLTQNVRQGEGDSYGQLIAGQHILEHTQNSIRKNRAALRKAYFGKIHYRDLDSRSDETFYIGKNGITRNQTDVIIVDWRAPVSSIYYENETGAGSYTVPGEADIAIDLKGKRTFDIAGDTLLGYYDDDAAANDELLVKYLSQNKEAVLGDIIATIQKEQNLIIRDIPYKNIIVQGVAGSGKTTVALHRISYLLYNYENQYKPSEFCIIGSSDMLLNYISSGLPELDVNHVKQMRMDLFLPYLMDKGWKRTYHLAPDHADAPEKSKLHFIKALEQFLLDFRKQNVSLEAIRDENLGTILSEENLTETYRSNSHLSVLQLEKLLNARIASRIKFLCSDGDSKEKGELLKKYKNYFHSDKKNWNVIHIYGEFLSRMELKKSPYEEILKGNLDIYDAAAIALIWKRLLTKKDNDEFSQIIIDEAQDYGETIYYVLKQLLPQCYFTIMGDVSQNIRYDTGMNDWGGLKEAIFQKESDSFYLLSKSYRNTIEISQCAGTVLEKAAQGDYKIQPVIRHGKEVSIHQVKTARLHEQLKTTVEQLISSGYETIAVICRDDKDAELVRNLLNIETDPHAGTDSEFHNGVMVLPVTLTKGLEFDAVVLWKPDREHYENTPKDAKLLYVAITRALHELHMILDGEISELLTIANKL